MGAGEGRRAVSMPMFPEKGEKKLFWERKKEEHIRGQKRGGQVLITAHTHIHTQTHRYARTEDTLQATDLSWDGISHLKMQNTPNVKSHKRTAHLMSNESQNAANVCYCWCLLLSYSEHPHPHLFINVFSFISGFLTPFWKGAWVSIHYRPCWVLSPNANETS